MHIRKNVHLWKKMFKYVRHIFYICILHVKNTYKEYKMFIFKHVEHVFYICKTCANEHSILYV